MAEETKISVDEMTENGVHLGHRTSKLHPSMEEFVVGIKNTVHIINLEKTKEFFEKALDYIEKESPKLMIVGTKIPLQKLVKEMAQEANTPYVTARWLGGTFTNFTVIKKRAQYYKDLQQKKETGELEKYTKKERIQKEKELQDLSTKFEGIQDLENLPDAVFICDIVKDDLALKEAQMKGVKTIAIVDTNADISQVDYPIPANDDAISSVKYILEKVVSVIKK